MSLLFSTSFNNHNLDHLQLLVLLASREEGGLGEPAAQPDHQARDLVHLLREQTNLSSNFDVNIVAESFPNLVNLCLLCPTPQFQDNLFSGLVDLKGVLKRREVDDKFCGSCYLLVILGALLQEDLMLPLGVNSQASLHHKLN